MKISNLRSMVKFFNEKIAMKYTIVFLIDSENEEFFKFYELIYGIFKKLNERFEIIVIANGTAGFIESWLEFQGQISERLKVIIFRKKVSQFVCLKAILNESNGSKILSLGPFQELSSESYKHLIQSMTKNVDLVVPSRKFRKDAFLNRLHSGVLNKAVRVVLGVKLKDIGCVVKLFRREVLKEMDFYSYAYDYLAVLAIQKGFTVKEVECDQSQKVRKTTFYKFKIYIKRLTEILNLFFSTNFSKMPLRFFNIVGASLVFSGILSISWVFFQRIAFHTTIGSQPLLIIGFIGLVGGTQMSGFGLLGEIISFVHGRSQKGYTIEKII